MGWTTAAIIGSAAISAYSSKKAADKQAKAAGQAGQLSAEQFRQTREDLAPYRGAGTAAINELSSLYGLPIEGGYPTINQDGTRADPAPANALAGPIGSNLAEPIANIVAGYGRNGDTEMAHVTPGETVVPREMMQNPDVRNALSAGFNRMGLDPGRYTVGGNDDSINPVTGAREYFTGNEPGGSFSDAGRDWDRSFGDGPSPDRNPSGEGNDPFDRNRFRFSRSAVAAPQPAAPAQPVDPDYYTQDAAIQRFYDSPDYRLAFDEGQAALERSAAARGGLFSGNTGAALTKYGQQLGGQWYGNYYNRLANLAGLGQNAAAQTGNYGAQAAANQGNALIAGGNAQAAGYQGIGSAINSGVGNYLLYDYLRQ